VLAESEPRIMNTIPGNCLVPERLQPEYLPLAGVEIPEAVNLCDQLVDAHVAAGAGGQPAIHFADERCTLTFHELQGEVARLAGAFLAAGLRPGDRIAVRGPNRPETTTAILAAWRVGAIVVPVPPQARAREIPFFLTDTGAHFLVLPHTDPGIDEVVKCAESPDLDLGVERVLTAGSCPGPLFVSLEELVAGSSPVTDPVLVPRDVPALIWHTGGTTGTPKACYHTAERFLAGGYAAARAWEFRPDEVPLAFPGPVGHAAGLIGRTTMSMLHGLPHVEVQALADPHVLLDALSRYRVTWGIASAVLWAKMLPIYATDPGAYDLSALDSAYGLMISMVSHTVYEGWKERGVLLRNPMGSTQFATWFMTPGRNEDTPPACVGRPSPGYQAAVIDTEKPGWNELGPEEIGLLAVKGPSGLTYWNRPAAIQERDVRDGWTVMDDLAKRDGEGRFWYLGRADFMINTAGFKVAPVEVEDVLAEHPAVAESAVVGSPDPERGEAVTAWIVLNRPFTPGEELGRELQDFVKSRISPYKYPRRVVFTPSLPRDPVGKVQVRELRDRSQAFVSRGGAVLILDN
jgi:2-aminobenzoate-CoA ligase